MIQRIYNCCVALVKINFNSPTNCELCTCTQWVVDGMGTVKGWLVIKQVALRGGALTPWQHLLSICNPAVSIVCGQWTMSPSHDNSCVSLPSTLFMNGRQNLHQHISLARVNKTARKTVWRVACFTCVTQISLKVQGGSDSYRSCSMTFAKYVLRLSYSRKCWVTSKSLDRLYPRRFLSSGASCLPKVYLSRTVAGLSFK